MDDRVPWHQELTYRTGVNDTFTVADSDIVTFLREDACQYGEWENACTAEGPCPSCMAADEIERLREELKYQTLWAELLSGNKCHCVAEDAGVCMPCAYRQTMKQNEEASRG